MFDTKRSMALQHINCTLSNKLHDANLGAKFLSWFAGKQEWMGWDVGGFMVTLPPEDVHTMDSTGLMHVWDSYYRNYDEPYDENLLLSSIGMLLWAFKHEQ